MTTDKRPKKADGRVVTPVRLPSRSTGPTTRSSSAPATTAWSTGRTSQGRTQDAHPRAPPDRRWRGHHRRTHAGLLVHDVLVRALLLRPQIIHDLELTRHGFMPLLMSSSFAPTEDGDYLWLGQDHGQNLKEIARHSKHDADAYTQYAHDMEMVCRAIKPLLDSAPPDLFSDDPEELMALAALGARFRGMDKRTLHNTVRLLTGSAADFLDDYFESDILKGYLASLSIIGSKVGPYSQGSGLVMLFHSLGEYDGEFGAWAFHKRGNGGFTQALARAARSFGAEIVLEAPVASVITNGGRATGIPGERNGIPRHDRGQRTGPPADVLELVNPRELPTDLVNDEPAPFPGHVVQGQLRARRIAQHPALPDRGDQFRGFTNRSVDGIP